MKDTTVRMERGAWRPICERPDDLVWPVAVGRGGGAGGLTWAQVNGPRYERVGKGLYVPTSRRHSVEQRIVDAAARLAVDGSRGFVTAWAALRWRGAAYFDGMSPGGHDVLPVDLAIPGHTRMREADGVRLVRRGVGVREFEVVAGLPVATVQRALFDEIHRRDNLWAAVQAIDMTAAARLISAWLFAVFVGRCNSRNGAPLAREAVSYAVDESLSPREPWFRLVWEIVAGLDRPLVNEPVFDRSGQLIGIPDLFDPLAGLAGEYQGEIHRSARRHRRDVVRAEDFRAHGIEVVEVVAGDYKDVAAARLLRARSRAQFLSTDDRSWTLDRPSWYPATETLDRYFERIGMVDVLTAVGRAVARDSSVPGQPETALGA